MKPIAICVGHSRDGDMGAVSTGGVSEWDFNEPVAQLLNEKLTGMGFESKVFSHYGGTGYGAAMRWIAGAVRAVDAPCAIELHFNAASPSANGYEYLHWHSSVQGRRLAELMLEAQAGAFPDSRNRGPKETRPDSRGGGFLRRTHCPAVICEPFFGSNADEWALYSGNTDKLAQVYADALQRWVVG